MKTALITFLNQLGENPRQRLAFANNADSVMADAGLDASARRALRLRDSTAIYEAAGLEAVQPPKIVNIPQSFG